MPDIRELGRKVKAKYPGKYDDLDDGDVGRRVKARYPGAYDDFTDAPAAQPTSFLEDVKIGAERGYRKYLEPAISSLAEVTEGMKSGDFGPALQMAKEAARGTYRALTIPDPKIVTDAAGQRQLQARPPDPVLQQAQAARSARYAASPEGRRSAERLAALDVRAGQDPSIASKITRGTTEVLTGAAPSLATAIATRGAILPTSIAAGLQSAARPAEIGPQAAVGTLPVPVGQAFRAGINQIRRTFGKGAAQVIEAEAAPAATTQLRQAIPEVPPATSLPSVFTKLETDNVEQIGSMIANANRRYASAKNITPEERLSAWDDYNRLKDLTPDEQRALSQVLPARTYSPVTAAKDYSRDISDIPSGQPDPQLDANLRELEQFFGGQPRLGVETGPPALSADMSISAASPSVRAASASVTGPRVGADLDLSVAPAGTAPPLPPGVDVPTGFGGVAPRGQQQLFRAAARSPWQDSVLAYFRANVLSGPVGRATDLGSTIVNQFADAAVRPVAAAVDVIVSKFNKRRAITGLSAEGTGRAFKSIPQGLRDAREVLKTGQQAIDSGADDVLYGREIQSGLSKGFDVPVNGVFRFLGAMDAPFRRFGFTRNLFDRAKVAAINESKRGRIARNQIDSRTRELMDRDDIINAAVRDGEKSVLSESNKISAWVANQTRNSPNARLMVGLVQPFLRIPFNAVLKGADFAGVGFVKALYKLARGGVRKAKGESFFRNLEEQRVFAQNVAAGSFGVAGFMLGMELEDQGKLEGYFYTGRRDFPNERVPTSIVIRGERYDINRLGGFIFAPLFVGATYNRLRKQDVGAANALLRSFGGLIQQAPALGYHGAPAKAGRILSSSEPGEEMLKEAGNIASGFIPASGLLGATAKAIDPLKKREAEGFTGPIMSKIPGLRERLSATGNDAIDAAVDRNSPLLSELQRLKVRVSELRRKDGEKDDAFNARVQQFSGNYTRFGQELISSPRFQAAPDALKAIALDRLNERAKQITHKEFAFPEIELDPEIIMDAAESSKKNPANQ